MLEEMGLKKAAVLKDADVVVFNTCHIREKAAEKVFSDLGRAYLVKLERAAEGRDTIIGVTGCVVQAEDKEILKRAPYVDFALGPLRYFRLREVVESVFRERERGKGTGQECSDAGQRHLNAGPACSGKSREGQQNAAYVRLNDAQEQIETGKIEKRAQENRAAGYGIFGGFQI